jgi:spore maturation protein CgeB
MLEDKYKSDILFLGAMYPNRQELLEAIVPLVKKYKLNFKICGHVQYMPKKSPLWEFVFDARTIPHKETVKYYNGANAVLNILRDINWNPRTKNKKNPFNKDKFGAESLNPRAYEVPLCQAFMLLEDTRPEAREIFTDKEVGFFSDKDSLIKQLHYFLIGPGKNRREEMAFQAYENIAAHHTYVNRLLYIKSVIEPIIS